MGVLKLHPQHQTKEYKMTNPNQLQLRNSTAEFLTFAYQSNGDGVEVCSNVSTPIHKLILNILQSDTF